ncbi:GDP-L-galactose phosphorylase 1 isoform X2 [Jatropha curcas]|uniref:GDP-L-galactose phosphorylase 1 isoform X2 n=1 Tax=Jatropha curcas TaxID=180498 RepID=UPI001893BA9F|nr:GDP-L-galactose phosphorylase 1 isoform X2 [Jatropha curcas]
MLTIKKVPTVVSNYQEENSERNLEGCGRNCLGNCCLPGSNLPLYSFKKDTEKSIENGMVRSSQDRQQAQICFLHNLLLGQWEDRMTRGLFRYDVTTCQSTIIPGRYGFIAQLNEGRHLKKRPTEFRVDKVSPIEYGHVLLIPRILDCLPQRIDSESFLLAVYLAKEASDPFFRVGYNSLGAFATINHLHFQAYYLAVSFPVEKAPTKRITLKGTRDKGVVVSRLLNYPVKGLVFEGGNTIEDLSDSVSSSCIYLQNNNVPFNVLIADCGNRIFLFPQCYAEKQALGEVSQELLNTQVNPAVWEVSGHIVLKRRKDFEDASEAYIWRLLAEVSVSEERFQEVTTRVLEAAGFEEVKKFFMWNQMGDQLNWSNNGHRLEAFILILFLLLKRV